ncbi:uncharacterized protein FA14DRAFT_128376, partial [Meira miltonrushii]
RTYDLIIRRSAIHGQVCTFGSKGRRLLDPFPIVQLDVRDKFGKRDVMGQSSPLFLMQKSNLGSHSLPKLRETSFSALRLLEGKLIASPYILKDCDEDQRAFFFIFADLSIRLRGTFRLEFSLIKLGPRFSSTSARKAAVGGEIVAKTISEPFQMHHAEDFAGMTKSTPLAKSLASQGAHIPIRMD